MDTMNKIACVGAGTSIAIDDCLLTLLKQELTGEEQQLFCMNFQMYLYNNAKTDFVIDLDNVYKWLGFSTKGNAKVPLVKRGCILRL